MPKRPLQPTLRVLGSGDAFGSGGRSHTSFYLDAPSAKILIDFGASALVSMHRLGIDPAAIDAILVSHLHGDHFGGLVFFLLDAAFMTRRRRTLTIAGPRGTAARLRQTSEAMFPGVWNRPRRYRIRFIEFDHRAPVGICGALVTAFRVVHGSGAPAFALRVQCDGATVAYSGDTAWTEQLVEAARGADLFLIEASSFSEPIPDHLTYRTVESCRDRFEVDRLVLTHVGPDVLARKKSLSIEIAEDGQLFQLGSRRERKRRMRR